MPFVEPMERRVRTADILGAAEVVAIGSQQ